MMQVSSIRDKVILIYFEALNSEMTCVFSYHSPIFQNADFPGKRALFAIFGKGMAQNGGL